MSLCNECKYNNNGWCNKYKANGKKKIELCDKFNIDDSEDTIYTITELLENIKENVRLIERMINER